MDIDVNLKKDFTDAMSEFLGHNYGKSVELLTQILALDPKHILARTARGSAFFKLGNLEGALADFNRVIEVRPDYIRAFHLRGLVYARRGDDALALADLNKAIELDPEYGAAYYSRAALNTRKGDTDAAAEDISMATHLSNLNIERFSNENNVWRSQQIRVEELMETEVQR